MEPQRNVKAIWAWALYDFANTIFSMNVVSRYFALWVTDDHGAQDIYFSIPLSISMLAVAVSVPVFGAISDQTGRRVRPLLMITLGCVFATAAIGAADSLYTGLALFALANFFYQSALVFYDGLLPTVSRGTSVAKVSGYGVSLGYVGAIVGLMAVTPIANAYGRSAVFVPTAILFLLFAAPCFIWVRDRAVIEGARVDVGKAFRRLADTLMSAREHRDLFLFLLASFFIRDGVNTVIAFMSVYANKVMGMTGTYLTIFLITATTGAAVGALMWGWITNRYTAHTAMQAVCAAWLFTLVFAAVTTNETLFWLIGPMAGVSLSGVWVAGRTLIVDLAPPERVGEFFGLFNLAGKAASIMGPMVWGVIVALASPLGGTIQHRIAVFSLVLFIGVGWILLRFVQVPARRAD